MKVLVGGQPLLYPEVGIRRTLVGLLHALVSLEGAPRMLLGGVPPRLLEPARLRGVDGPEFVRRLLQGVPGWLHHEPERGIVRKLWKRRRSRARRALRRQVLREAPDLYWELTPLPNKTAWLELPTIASVYDLVYHWDVPGMKPRDRARYADEHPRYLAGARHLVAVSEWTRQDVMTRLGIPGERISVVPPAAGPEFAPLAPWQDRAALRRRLGLPERYLLHVGSLQPRKNLVRLVRAHDALVGRGHAVDLVLCGRDAWLCDELFEAIAKSSARARVQVRRDVRDADLPSVYGLAEAFVMPSLFEGFGIPVLEAMACGTPVVSSTAGALPEVVGGAAVLVDPEDEWGMTDALDELLECSEQREALRVLGLEQASRYSWEASARTLCEVFRAVGVRAD